MQNTTFSTETVYDSIKCAQKFQRISLNITNCCSDN